MNIVKIEEARKILEAFSSFNKALRSLDTSAVDGMMENYITMIEALKKIAGMMEDSNHHHDLEDAEKVAKEALTKVGCFDVREITLTLTGTAPLVTPPLPLAEGDRQFLRGRHKRRKAG